ncbi:MAG: hypothetical protein HYV07_00700 [Deltaproteobacteria bacterium]|nr:hypothetical protein [Deltaproteobacteria bacterium]
MCERLSEPVRLWGQLVRTTVVCAGRLSFAARLSRGNVFRTVRLLAVGRRTPA